MQMPTFPPFNAHEDVNSLAVRWRRWLARFENMLEALNIQEAPRKKAMLLHYAGEDVIEIYEGLNLDAGRNTAPSANEGDDGKNDPFTIMIMIIIFCVL